MKYDNGISTQEESYWFGFLLGDGNLSRNRNRVTVVLQDRDKAHLGKLKAFFDGEGYLRVFQPGYTQYSIERKKMANNLRQLGLRPAKTHDVNWRNISYDYPVDFLRGLLDADGTIFLKLPVATMRWYGTQSITEGIRDFLEMHEICTPLGKVREDRGAYVFAISGRWKTQELAKYLYRDPTIYLQRKYDKVRELRKYNEEYPRMKGRLTKDDIDRIFALSNVIQQKDIASRFGVSSPLICRILKGDRYAKE